MSAAFLRDITENIRLPRKQADIAGYVAYAPAGLEALFDGMLADGTQLVLADGTRRHAGRRGRFRPLPAACDPHAVRPGHSAVCVLNSDSPTLPTACLVQAARPWQRAAGVVLGAAEDGGYYLLGMNAASTRALRRHRRGARSASPRRPVPRRAASACPSTSCPPGTTWTTARPSAG